MTYLFDLGNVLLAFDFIPALNSLKGENPEPDALEQIIQKKDAFESGKISLPDFITFLRKVLDYKGDDKDIFLEGPNGIKGFYIQGNSFMFSQNAYMNQAFQQMGATVKPFEALSNSIQFLNQALGADGFSLEKQYDLPQFEQMAYYFDQQIFKGEPEQKSFKIVGA